jgi:hypothetical protein
MQQLRISDNQRFLIYKDGSPFFYLSDTAWELFHRLNREEANPLPGRPRRQWFHRHPGGGTGRI